MKDVFSYNLDIHKTAYMNWRTDKNDPIGSMNAIANGYFQSALLLAKECLKNNLDKKADAVIFPMLFSVNHGIELYIKSICWSLNILLGHKSKYKENHNIRGLWDAVKQKIKELGYDNNEESFKEMTASLEAYIEELTSKIMKDDRETAYYNIDFSRYPINNKDEYHFYMKTYENVVVDLENFIQVFSDIGENLDCLAGYYLELVSSRYEENY